MTSRFSEHEYEPIAPPSPAPATAPIVRITDTDLVPVADSDESLDDRAIPPELILDGGIILPLDGKIEDSVMEGQELAETGDTSEEQLEETAQQLQDRLEERFLSTATPGTESRTDGEVNTSQVDSSALEELPLRRGARGLPQRLRTQAGKLRSRLRGFQRPTFSFSTRQKSEKTRSTSSGKSDKSKRSSEKRPSRIDRLRSSFSERPRFSLPERPKFNLPERPKFHLPERPKFNLPERPKFNIKKPNIKFPTTLRKTRKPPPLREQQQQRSTESAVGWRRNIFDFSTYPRIFDKKSKRRGDYATSSPKDSRAQSAESSTFPRTRKGLPLSVRLAQRFGETGRGNGSWLKEPGTSTKREKEATATAEAKVPWEEPQKQSRMEESDEIQYIDYDQESPETSDRQPHPSREASRTEEESYEREPMDLDPRLYGDQGIRSTYSRAPREVDMEEGGRSDWRQDDELMIAAEEFRPIQRSRSLNEQVSHTDERYNGSFPPVDPRRFEPRKMPSEEEEMEEGEVSSAPSDREQQHSSGSSCDRRRRGVIEEIDSDEFFLRESGISQDDMNLGKYLTSEIREAFRSDISNALADDEVSPTPPQRPIRTRSLRKRKEGSVESYNVIPPVRPKRERSGIRRSEESVDYLFRERARSDSRHRVVYQAEGSPREESPAEPLDDIVIVKPMRRKSKSSLRSQSQPPTDTSIPPSSIMPELSRSQSPPLPSSPPVAPTRRKRPRRETAMNQRNGDIAPMYNGHPQWANVEEGREELLPPMKMENLEISAIGMTRSEEDLRIAMRLQGEDYVEPVPVPPKRRSRSRGTSVAQDDDRTSHGAESLPEVGYVEEDILRDDIESARDLSGYAIVEKREKPPRPPPPRKRRDKFATTPRPTPPKRPQRAYSTLGPAKSKERKILFGSINALEENGSTPYIEIDSDGEHKDLRSGEILSKMQSRPLPAPPRPPRAKKENTLEREAQSVQDFPIEVTAATQTDPLPDDMVIEEEVTQAKLVVTPSRSGSQILVSTERIPSPSRVPTPPVPPLPTSQFLRRDEEDVEEAYDALSLKSASPARSVSEERRFRQGKTMHTEEIPSRSVRSALLSDETLRIGSLEVGDLKVDRLSVSQIEAQRLIASEVDAMVITASELRNEMGSGVEESLSPSIIKELIAIRSHLETAAASQAQIMHSTKSTKEDKIEKKTDIPPKDEEIAQCTEVTSDTVVDQLVSGSIAGQLTSVVEQLESTGDVKSAQENQKVVKTEVIDSKDKEIPTIHTLTIAQVQVEDKKIPVHTLTVVQTEIEDTTAPDTHSPSFAPGMVEKCLQISDSDASSALNTETTGDINPERSTEEPVTDFSTAEIISGLLEESKTTTTVTVENIGVNLQLSEKMTPLDDKMNKEDIESKGKTTRRSTSRSRSPSPVTGICSVRQTASPVRSLPPIISVTPDTPDSTPGYNKSSDVHPQRAVISYSTDVEYSQKESHDSQRESSMSPTLSFPLGGTHFIAFPASQVPPEFFSMNESTSLSQQGTSSEPSIVDTTQQLLRALRIAGNRAMRHFVSYLTTALGRDESPEKIREVELAICALLLLIAGLLIVYFSTSRTIMHYHHWDYFNPPQ